MKTYEQYFENAKILVEQKSDSGNTYFPMPIAVEMMLNDLAEKIEQLQEELKQLKNERT